MTPFSRPKIMLARPKKLLVVSASTKSTRHISNENATVWRKNAPNSNGSIEKPKKKPDWSGSEPRRRLRGSGKRRSA